MGTKLCHLLLNEVLKMPKFCEKSTKLRLFGFGLKVGGSDAFFGVRLLAISCLMLPVPLSY